MNGTRKGFPENCIMVEPCMPCLHAAMQCMPLKDTLQLAMYTHNIPISAGFTPGGFVCLYDVALVVHYCVYVTARFTT